MLGTDATFNYDPTKIIVSVKDLGITGHQAEVWLREQYNIEVELSESIQHTMSYHFGRYRK